MKADAKKATATLALGCFWGPEDEFMRLPGVIHTAVGFSGGPDDQSPTYEQLQGHVETVQIGFDPTQITFIELLNHFWKLHDPTFPFDEEYKSIIFYHDSSQKEQAEASLKNEQGKHDKQILTEIRPYEEFFPASEYHQKYLAKLRGEVPIR